MRILYIVVLLYAMPSLAMQYGESGVKRPRSVSDSVLCQKSHQNASEAVSRAEVKKNLRNKKVHRIKDDELKSHCCFELDQADCDEASNALAHMGFVIRAHKKKRKNGCIAALTHLFCCKKEKGEK
jgi:hypothetical protein